MPTLTVIAGPNGSGKSTLTEWLVRQGTRLGEYLDADDIARTLQGSPVDIAARAQQLVRDRREAALAGRRDHAFETVMSHPSHIEYMQRAAANGFGVRLYFVATEDPAINLDRVANRVLHGGHPVPPERIVSRYDRCLGNLPAAIMACDVCEVFDNSSASHPLRRLARIWRSSRGTTLTHQNLAVRRARTVDPADIPVWWLAILLEIKPESPFTSGLMK